MCMVPTATTIDARRSRVLQGLFDRLGYALIGAFFGAILGIVGWWLYGVAHSLNYSGPGMDPVLRHWVQYCGGAFSAWSFVFRERAADAVGDTVSAILHFEFNETPGRTASVLVCCVALAITLAAIWFTSPV